MDKTGVSFVEVIISMLILSLVMAGLANLFVATRKHTLLSRSRVTAGKLAGYWLDQLQMEVRQDQWDSGSGDYQTGHPLEKTAGTPRPETDETVGPITYTPTYQEIIGLPGDFPPEHAGRKVKLEISWTELGG